MQEIYLHVFEGGERVSLTVTRWQEGSSHNESYHWEWKPEFSCHQDMNRLAMEYIVWTRHWMDHLMEANPMGAMRFAMSCEMEWDRKRSLLDEGFQCNQ